MGGHNRLKCLDFPKLSLNWGDGGGTRGGVSNSWEGGGGALGIRIQQTTYIFVSNAIWNVSNSFSNAI